VLLDTYNCPPNIAAARRFVGVVANDVDVVEPRVAYLMPPPVLVPDSQRSVPFVLAALRGLPPLIASVRAVEVSTAPV
jgi:hypothetical protein